MGDFFPYLWHFLVSLSLFLTVQLRPMKFSAGDFSRITDEIKKYNGVKVMTNSITSNLITFATEDWIYDVQFEIKGTEVNVVKIKKRDEHERNDLSVPMSLRSGNYDELVAELLFFLDIIDEGKRDKVVYGEDLPF